MLIRMVFKLNGTARSQTPATGSPGKLNSTVSNPLTSIGPMLQIKGIRKELSKVKKKVVAVSPLIGDKSISGPADKYMQAAGIESNAYGLAKMYSDVCSNIIVDTKERKFRV